MKWHRKFFSCAYTSLYIAKISKVKICHTQYSLLAFSGGIPPSSSSLTLQSVVKISTTCISLSWGLWMKIGAEKVAFNGIFTSKTGRILYGLCVDVPRTLCENRPIFIRKNLIAIWLKKHENHTDVWRWMSPSADFLLSSVGRKNMGKEVRCSGSSVWIIFINLSILYWLLITEFISENFK